MIEIIISCPDHLQDSGLQELLADLRTWEGGIRQFLIDEKCDPDVIDAVMAHEKNA